MTDNQPKETLLPACNCKSMYCTRHHRSPAPQPQDSLYPAAALESVDKLVAHAKTNDDNKFHWHESIDNHGKTIRAALSTDQYAQGFTAGQKSRDMEVKELVDGCKRVMDLLDEHGSEIVPHLMDTDENAGQKLRDLIAKHTNNQGEK